MSNLPFLHSLSPNVLAIPDNPLRALYPYAARPGMLNLASGHPSDDAYDLDGLAIACERAQADKAAWCYGPSTGDPDLLAALSPLCPVLPEGHRLIVTSGAQQAVDLALRVLAAPGRKVAVPEPVYPAILSICAAAGLTPLAYRVDPSDPSLTSLNTLFASHDIAAVYAMPTFSNPGGETWSLAVRRSFLEVCACHAVSIIEDDPYRELHFDGAPPASLLALSAECGVGCVIHAGSLSKILAPGLRLGWVAVPGALAGPITALRQAGDLQPNALAQRVAFHYLTLGRLRGHLVRVRVLYAMRQDRLYRCLREADFSVEQAGGGMFLYVGLPDHVPVEGLFARAVARSVLYAPGRAFAVSGNDDRFDRSLRLCFAGLDAETLAEAAHRLVIALERT